MTSRDAAPAPSSPFRFEWLEILRSPAWLPRRWRQRRAQELAAQAAQWEKAGDRRRAEVLFEASLAWEPNAEIQLRLAKLYYEDEDFVAAEGHYRAAVAADRSSAEALRGLAFTLHKKDRLEEALYFYLRLLRTGAADLDALVNVGGVLYALEKHEEALEYFRQAAAKRFTPDLAAQLGQTLYSLGRLEEATEVLERGRELDERHPLVLRLLGLVYEAQGDYPGAIECLQASVEVDPRDSATHRHLARVFSNTDRHADAVRYSLRAIEGQRDEELLAEIYWSLGWSLYVLGELEGSIQASLRALDLDDDQFGVHFNLGLALLVRGRAEDVEEARRHYRKGIDLVETPSDLEQYGLADVEAAIRSRENLPAAAGEIRALLQDRLHQLESLFEAVVQRARATGDGGGHVVA